MEQGLEWGMKLGRERGEWVGDAAWHKTGSVVQGTIM